MGSLEDLASSTVPSNRIVPSRRNATRSATVNAEWMSCVTTIEVTPSRPCRLRINSLIVFAVTGSSPVVGSS